MRKCMTMATNKTIVVYRSTNIADAGSYTEKIDGGVRRHGRPTLAPQFDLFASL
jgi:hypothetical protein